MMTHDPQNQLAALARRYREQTEAWQQLQALSASLPPVIRVPQEFLRQFDALTTPRCSVTQWRQPQGALRA